ncbi:MAG: amino acid adenylation domain-containing protein [Stigonema ocellatum SAG 48.90 = DSM 106950]|nr:amino acid adenylation domain-containing protein [Stigonema ocellatum SAG 48.90 = DSM 106950]
MSDLSQRLAGLSPEKLKLLAQRLNKKKGDAFSQSQISPQSRESNSFPLSFAQQRLWFLDQLQPGNIAYNISQAMYLKGWLNVAALEQSFHEIVRRHEVLRTIFAMVDGEPVQVISPSVNFIIPLVDLTELPETAQKVKVQQLATNEAQHPFDLAHGPLLRVTLLKLGEAEHVLLFVMHHIVSDAKSCGIIIQELAVLYKAFSVGQPSLLPELSIQYADFAYWQRQWLQGAVLAEQLAYWKQQLADTPPVLALPTDRSSLGVQNLAGDCISFQLSLSLSAMLKKFSQSEGATLFITLLAAFQALLYRYSAQDDFCVGTAIDNRKIGETDTLIGFFVNNLVLRADLSGNPSFRELLTRVREVALAAYAHQDLPFEKLVEELQPERNLNQNPLFRVMFVFWNAPMADLKLGDLSLSTIDIDSVTSRFDLTLAMADTQQGLVASFEYNTGLFDAATITRMVGHFQTLLSGIVANPDQRLTDLPILTAAEQHQLLVEWNNTATNYPKVKCIHQLFEIQVEQQPDAVAVVFEDEHLTYRELNYQANQLAHHLQTLGVSANVLVGICVERSLDMLVGLLGILKAGGAYVPLDPEYPQERLSFMLEDAQLSVLLSQQHLVEKLPEHQARVVCLDTDWEEIKQKSDSNPLNAATPSTRAYVIYTSGSTGQPKGVLVNHTNVVRLFAATELWYQFNSQDVWTLFHSYAFDFSVWEIWGALLYGGRLVVVPHLVRRSPEAFYKLLCQEKVTILNQTPSAFRQLIQAEQSIATAGDLKLRLVIFGGEALEVKSLQPWFDRHGDQQPQLVNMYGITETTVHVTYRPLSQADVNRTGSVIGRPIPDLEVYVLDQHLQPVPIGVPGEMYIGGAGVTSGYLNRPSLTAQRFISNPFADNPKARLYKSGDLARYLPNGELEYLGRIDHQVKIRGFRIELGEIEAVLVQHQAVRETVVLAREVQLGDNQLVAYVVPNSKQTPTISQLRTFLKKQLPEYMVPTVFVMLEALPLLPNGKVNRQMLPAPDFAQLEPSDTFVAPHTPIEQVLAGIWAEVLGLEKVSIHSNFFDLGGHSLLATRVISQVRKIFKVDLALRRLFEEPTVIRLAKDIERAIHAGLGLELPPIKRISRDSELPLSFAQARLWFLAQLEQNSPFYNIPSAFRLQGRLNLAALEQSLNEILRRHEVLRTTFLTVEGRPVPVISSATRLDLPIIDLCKVPESQQQTIVRQLTITEAKQPFDLSTGPMLRVKLLWVSEQEYVVLFTMHHIVADGWSIGVLVREMATLYQAFCNGQPSPLGELPIQYVDFAVWQRQSVMKEVFKAQLSYWRQHLEGAPTLLQLPTDYKRPTVATVRGATYSFSLSQELSFGLKTLSRKEESTLFMTLLAAFKILLYRYTLNTDIVVGTPIANRHQPEIEGLIGFFVNILVLRTDLSDNPCFDELLGRVREVALQAYTHQDLPFEQLVEELQPQRSTSYTPLFQVMFVLQNAPLASIELSGLTVSSLESNIDTAKFDLTLSMQETTEELIGTLEYNSDLFDEGTICRMVGHLHELFTAIVANPKQHLDELPLLTEAEQHQLLVAWNDTQAEYPINQCIHQLIESFVERSPDAVAVVFEDQHLTYQELNVKANQLAHHLQALGVEPEVLVGICLERSVEMIVGVVGILKAGGAYVPLDPTYPQERLDFVLQDTQLSVLLTQQRLIEKLPQHQVQVVCLDTSWSAIAQQSKQNPPNPVKPKNLAYIIYTSGSTGQPKGVQITHQNLVHSTWSRILYYSEPVTSFLLVSPFVFDSSVASIFWTLCQGGVLSLPQEKWKLELLQLIEMIAQRQISHILCLPSLYKLILEYTEPRQLDSVCTVIVAGESCSAELVKLHHQLLPHTPLFNEYGPTEGTVWSSVYNCQNHDVQKAVPIGRPISNTQIYTLDEHLQPVPIGIPGELYIGGDGLARGYLNRPQLTSEKFIPNPFCDSKSERLYKTGDLARYRSDGNIEFLGRIDHQVKIRGFRIELGEIEAVLAQHPEVLHTVVIARENNSGDKSLVGYLVPKSEKAPTSSELRRFLKEKLPDYMIPSVFMVLEALPLTPNGKVNREALPTPDQNRTEREKVYVEPRTPVEELLTRIWSQVLGIEQVGIYDNFFDLGGHSMLITQLVVRVRETFQVELPLLSLFEMPTIAELAQSIAIAQNTGASSTTVGTKTLVNLKAEAVLDPTIYPNIPFQYITEPACIFLTGATGFVGAFLLHELLLQTNADIYCLVRAPDLKEGKKRIQNSLESYLLWDESLSCRIIPVVGDLSQPLLGLSQEEFQAMAELVDVIYHNGAWVNHTSPYSVLKAANVLGTQEVLRLASQVKVKQVHFISTKSVFSSVDDSEVRVVREHDSLDDYELPSVGYSQSKWVAEQLVTIARDRGLPVCIYRIGRVSGHSQTGVFNRNDFLYKLIIGCIQLGSLPEKEMIEDMAPVDYISRAIVHLSRQKESLDKAFHFVNHQPFNSRMLLNVLNSFGYPLQQISYDQWRKYLLKVAERSPEHTLYPLVSFFPSRSSEKETSNLGTLQFDCQNTLNGLAGTSIVCPPVDEQLLSTYLSYLIHNGFLIPPQPDN